MYSAASAVFINECLKGFISFCIALYNTLKSQATSVGYSAVPGDDHGDSKGLSGSSVAQDVPLLRVLSTRNLRNAGAKVLSEIFSADCWKLGVPACLYVIQNNVRVSLSCGMGLRIMYTR
jgi:UDP-sugar transporter A1/2/3